MELRAGKDALPTFLTIFGIVRDQYFYLGESIVSAVPEAESSSGPRVDDFCVLS